MSRPAPSLFEPTGRLSREADLLRHEVSDLRHFMGNLRDMADLVDTPEASGDLSSLMETMLWKILDAIDAEEGVLMLLDHTRDELVYIAGVGAMAEHHHRGERTPRGHGLAGWVVASRGPMMTEDRLAADARGDRETAWHGPTAVAAPLVAGDRVMGVVEVLHRRRAPFSPERLDMLVLACRFAGELLGSLEARQTPPAEAY